VAKSGESSNSPIEVAEWRRRNRPMLGRAERKRRRQKRAWFGLAFGLAVALVWHFSHLAGATESYSASLTDLHFWFHLAFEGLLAVYAALIGFIISGMLSGEV